MEPIIVEQQAGKGWNISRRCFQFLILVNQKLIQQDLIPKNSPVIARFNTYIRTCEMSSEELIDVIKKWCDNNPQKTHLMFSYIAIEAFLSLPIKQNCYFE